MTTTKALSVIAVAILLFLTTTMMGCSTTERLFHEEVEGALSQTEFPDTSQRVSQVDLRELPDPVQVPVKSTWSGRSTCEAFGRG